MRKFAPEEHREHNIYQTGSIKPPKAYQSILSAVLMVVIFMGGLFSALQMLKLLPVPSTVSEQVPSSLVSFSRNAAPLSADSAVPALGMEVQQASKLIRKLYGWPEGLYVSQVLPTGAAHRASICAGDILLKINNVPTDNETTYARLISNMTPGQRILLTVYRRGRQLRLPLIVGG